MSQSQDTRQALYDRIKSSTKDAVILEEMTRLGFWKQGDVVNSVPEQLILKEQELVKAINELHSKQRLYQNKETALKEMRKARLQESKRKQAERKEIRKLQKEEKAKAWLKTQTEDIQFVGEGYSSSLLGKVSDVQSLVKYGLPDFENIASVAQAIGISVNELRFLAFSRKVSTVSHYKKFLMPKKSGGERLISAPMPRLKGVQHWILRNILDKVEVHFAANGFVKGKNIVTNAKLHVHNDILLNIDLKDFFPSIDYPRVRGVFVKLGYSSQISSILALLCTEPETQEVEMDGKTYFVQVSERKLPQGAPTSPAITNILCRRLDARLKGLADKYGFVYSRYADDLSFSAKGDAKDNVHQLLANVRKVVSEENFTIHPEKLHIMRNGNRKEVTGVVVNDKPSVNAKEVDRFRALLFQIEKDGTLDGKHWNGASNLLAAMQGYANFIYMVDPAKGEPLKMRVRDILKQFQFKHHIKHKPKVKKAEAGGSAGVDQKVEASKKTWWKFWK